MSSYSSPTLAVPNMSSSSMRMPSPMQQPPQTPEFLPSISPSVVYSTAHAVWSPHEMQIFHRGFAEFPADKYDNVTRYIKIAAMLPGKCVRDVAFKAKALSISQEKMSMNRDHFSKRMKIEPYQEVNSDFTLSSSVVEMTRFEITLTLRLSLFHACAGSDTRVSDPDGGRRPRRRTVECTAAGQHGHDEHDALESPERQVRRQQRAHAQIP